ncbi:MULTISPECIES: XRE family transcriptional regulator [unclassified Phyllobacterium]|uniref:XRE family transcriptional regulator n=1 Tax=unclassified Phyllobacterium TaxID=2638441 RepID=UPI003012A622
MSSADVGDFYVGRNYNVDMSTIGERIRSARDMKGLTQQDVADHFGIARVSVTQWESGITQPGRDKFSGLAELLGGSPDWYMTGKGQIPVSDLLKKRIDEQIAKTKRKLSADSYDPDNHDAPMDEEQMTIGSETGTRGIPDDASPQIDITAGMGAGGFSITNEGVPGKHGMTFAADAVKDYWRLPPAILVTLGLASKDIAIFPVQGDSMQPTLEEGEVVFVDMRHRIPSPDGLYAIIDDFGGLAVKRLEVGNDPVNGEIAVSIISDNPRHKIRYKRPEDLFIVGRVLKKFGNLK